MSGIVEVWVGEKLFYRFGEFKEIKVYNIE